MRKCSRRATGDMSTGEKKPATPATSTPPSTSPPAKPVQQSSQPPKQPVVSRRTFLKAAVGASVVLAGASMATSGGILSPLVPPAAPPFPITNAATLESAYDAIRGKVGQVAFVPFYWPYDVNVSPYYKNALVRLPDEVLDPSDRGSTPNIKHYAAWNLTCVHLRCIVNPGYDPTSEQYRLICPCHGSQYLLTNAVPVAGPAFDLGLRPLPKIIFSMDSSNNIIAERFDGEPGIGRTD